MKKITFLLAMMLVTFTACNNEDFEEISLESKREKISYEVTPEEAVSRLGMFLSNNGTRASLNDVTIKTLMKSDFVPATRSSNAEDAPAIYLIDIPDGGCAVMGADKRLEPVYAIMDETKLSPEDLTTAITRTESASEEDIQTYVTGMINDAIEADILGYEGVPIDTTVLVPNPLPYCEEWSDTTYTCQVSPLLKTKWHQGSPFNDKFPVCTNGYHKDAGCGVIAAAQVVYYNRRPNFYQNVNFNWNLISQYEYPANPSNAATTAVANFIYALADGVNADLSNTNTTLTNTDPTDIKNFFRAFGYPNANFYSYSLSYITPMLNNNKPIIICGWNSIRTVGHAWVIDGCKIFQVEHWIRYNYISAPAEEYIEYTENYNLLHCNYGWGGTCDGYYTSGVFDTRNILPDYCIDSTIGDSSGSIPYAFDTNLGLMQY